MTVEEFAETMMGTPKKSQQVKQEQKPSPVAKAVPEGNTTEQLIPYPKRDPQSSNICKIGNKDSIRIYYQNVQSIGSKDKQKRFNKELANNYDVIVFTETWLKNTSKLEIFDEGFDVYRCDRTSGNSDKKRGGGVLVAVSSKLYSDPVIIEDINGVEYVCVKILHHGHFIYIYSLYMPGELKGTGRKHVEAIGAIGHCKNDTLIVLGDFNIDNVKWAKSASEDDAYFVPDRNHKLLRSLGEMGLYQLNNIENSYGNVLDLAFVNKKDAMKLSETKKICALTKVVPFHPPFEILIDSLNFPRDLSAHVKEEAYLIRENCSQQLNKLIEKLYAHAESDVLELEVNIS